MRTLTSCLSISAVAITLFPASASLAAKAVIKGSTTTQTRQYHYTARTRTRSDFRAG